MNRIVCFLAALLITVTGLQPACSQIRLKPVPLSAQSWPAGVGAKGNFPKNRAYEYTFSDIQTSTIENWLSYVNVKIPVQVSGLLSGWVWAQRSDKGWLNFSGYRIEGQIVSPNLQVDQWELKDAVLRFGFVDNVWYVGRLSGNLFHLGDTQSIGKADLAATLPMDNERLLQVSGGITEAQLQPLLKAFNVDFAIANDNGGLNAAANVPLDLARDPAAWKMKANFKLEGIRSLDIPQSSISSEIEIDEGQWRIPSGTLTLIDQLLTFDGNGTLDRRLPYTASIAGKQLSVDQLLRAAKQPALISRVSGNFDVVGKIRGSLDRLVEAASAAVRSPSILIDGEDLSSVLLESVFDNRIDGQESLQLGVKSMAFAGGTIGGTIGWGSLRSLQQLFPDQAQLEIQSLDLSRIPNSLVGIAMSGIASGRVALGSRSGVNRQRHEWSTDCKLTVTNLSIFNAESGNTSLSLYKATDSPLLKATLENSDNSMQAVVDVDVSRVVKDDSGTLKLPLPYTASISGSQLSIGRLLRAARQPELTTRASGNVDVVGKIRGSIDRLVEAASVAVRSQSILIDGENLQSVRLEAVLDNRVDGKESILLDVKSLIVAGGNIRGTAGWESFKSIRQLVPNQTQFEIQSLDLARIPSSLTGVAVRGIANGRIAIDSRLSVDSKLRDWSIDSQLTVNDLSVSNSEVVNTSLSLHKAIDSEQLKATLENSDRSMQVLLAANFSNSLDAGLLGGIRSYSASGNVQRFGTELPLGSNRPAVPLIATGSFALRGTPKNWLSTGRVELAELKVELINQSVALTSLVANIREDEFRLERFDIRDAAAGTVAGSALIRRDGMGEHLLNLRIMDLEVEPYVTAVAPSEFHGLRGTINFETRLQKSATSADFISGWNGGVGGDISNVEYRTTPVGNLAFNGELAEDQITANVTGSVLSGDLALDGTLSREDLMHPVTKVGSLPISATITGINLQQLMSLIVGPRLGARYSGIANLQIDAREQTRDWQLRMGVPRFHFGRQELAKELAAQVRYRNDVLSVENLTGRLAGGRVNVQGEVQTGDTTGTLRFFADQLDVQSLAVMFFPNYAQNFSGLVSYRGNIRIGDEITLLGSSHFKDALVYGVPLQDLRTDLFISVSQNGALKEISARKIHGIAVGGRFDGEAQIRGGSRYSFDAHGKIGGGKLDQLSRALGFEKIVGTGSFDASTRLTSKDALSLAALSGPLQLDFTGGDVKSVPVLSEVGRLVPVVQLASSGIQSGTMRGQFGQGQFRFPGLLLNSDAFYLIASGGTSLSSGGINVDGLLQTGGSLNNQVTQGVTQKLFTAAFPELLLVAAINDFVRNRTVYFHIGGTPKHPVVQPKTAQTIARGLIQNVRRNLFVIPTASAAIATSNDN